MDPVLTPQTRHGDAVDTVYGENGSGEGDQFDYSEVSSTKGGDTPLVATHSWRSNRSVRRERMRGEASLQTSGGGMSSEPENNAAAPSPLQYQTTESSSGQLTRLDTDFVNDPLGQTLLSTRRSTNTPRKRLAEIFAPSAAAPSATKASNSGGSEPRSPRSGGSDNSRLLSKDDPHITGSDPKHHRALALLIRSLAALGVIYGDIGTSPLYTFQSIFSEQVSKSEEIPSKDEVIGALSAVLYTLFFVVCVKYCGFVLRADYHMEGGTFALYQRVMSVQYKLGPKRKIILLCLTCAGASLLLGESAITPAISILSALEGIELQAPDFKDAIVTVAVVILFLLFAMQYKGTDRVGVLFGPVMVLWFSSIAVIGAYNMSTHGTECLLAFNPAYLIRWFTQGYYSGTTGWKALASVVLTVTGTEALFADMGHFGRQPVYLSWFCFVFPCLVTQYCGQAAYLLGVISHPTFSFEDKATIFGKVFWSAIPSNPLFVYYGMIAVATLATIVASQALITGTFTLMSQASALEILPRLNVVHTSSQQKGQVYIGTINFVLGVLCCLLVITFETSARLAAAYGCAVTSVFFITTTIMSFYVAPYNWNYPWPVCALMFVLQGSIDGLFLSSNYLKIPDGGWFPLVLATCILTVMSVWKTGKTLSRRATIRQRELSACARESFAMVVYNSDDRAKLTRAESEPKQRSIGYQHNQKPSPSIIAEAASTNPTRSPQADTMNDIGCRFDPYDIQDISLGVQTNTISQGTGMAIFMSPSDDDETSLPISMVSVVSRLGVLPQFVIILSIKIASTPFVVADKRVTVRALDRSLHVFKFMINYGWAEPLSQLNVVRFLVNAVTFSEDVQDDLNDEEMCKYLRMLELRDSKTSVCLRDSNKPVSFFTNSNTTRASAERGFGMRLVVQAYNVFRKLFDSSAIEFFNLPPNSTTEVGNVLFI